MSDGRSVEQIQAEIDAARERLAGTIDELAFRAQPKEIARRQADSLRSSFAQATRDESGQLRSERLAAVLAAVAVVSIGIGLLRRARS